MFWWSAVRGCRLKPRRISRDTPKLPSRSKGAHLKQHPKKADAAERGEN